MPPDFMSGKGKQMTSELALHRAPTRFLYYDFADDAMAIMNEFLSFFCAPYFRSRRDAFLCVYRDFISTDNKLSRADRMLFRRQ